LRRREYINISKNYKYIYYLTKRGILDYHGNLQANEIAFSRRIGLPTFVSLTGAVPLLIGTTALFFFDGEPSLPIKLARLFQHESAYSLAFSFGGWNLLRWNNTNVRIPLFSLLSISDQLACLTTVTFFFFFGKPGHQD
jgi:hypothetical protein